MLKKIISIVAAFALVGCANVSNYDPSERVFTHKENMDAFFRVNIKMQGILQAPSFERQNRILDSIEKEILSIEKRKDLDFEVKSKIAELKKEILFFRGYDASRGFFPFNRRTGSNAYIVDYSSIKVNFGELNVGKRWGMSALAALYINKFCGYYKAYGDERSVGPATILVDCYQKGIKTLDSGTLNVNDFASAIQIWATEDDRVRITATHALVDDVGPWPTNMDWDQMHKFLSKRLKREELKEF